MFDLTESPPQSGGRTPKNRVKTEKHTDGNEYVISSSGVEYKGYYYEENGVAYAGKDSTVYPTKILLELAPVNFMADIALTTGFFTDAYNFAKSNLETAKTIADKVFPAKPVQQSTIPGNSSSAKSGMHSYVQKNNETIIREIDSSDPMFPRFKKDPTYKVVSINFSSTDIDQQIIEAEKTIPGIRTFVNL
jgi:hypothetical protein